MSEKEITYKNIKNNDDLSTLFSKQTLVWNWFIILYQLKNNILKV